MPIDSMNYETIKIYDSLSRFEKLKWKLGLGSVLQNLPYARQRMKKEDHWIKTGEWF